jgi:cyanophycinase
MLNSNKRAFLIGGSAAYESMADAFIAAAGGKAAHIALLLQGAEGWQRYLSSYSEPWIRRGVTSYQLIIPESDGELNWEKAEEILRTATAIFIGGGHTPTYHRLYATGPMAALIQERYQQGIPYAGISAGALLALENCVFFSDETPNKTIQIVPGLNLVKDVLIGVHFTATNPLPEVVEAMSRTHTKKARGIDDEACIVYENGNFKGILGQHVFNIEMDDFEKRSYHIVESHDMFMA